MRSAIRVLAYASMAAFGAGSTLAAQRSAPTIIDVRVVDSSRTPVGSADVTLVRGMTTTVEQRTTDATGRARIPYPGTETADQIVVRKVGYFPAYRFFTVATGDSAHVEIRLARLPVSLSTVKVTAEEDLKRKSYHLDADDIANTSRTMLDGTDLFKLRPDMMTARGGADECKVPFTQRDGWIESVWVNGERVALEPVDSIYVAGRKPALGIPVSIARPNPTISHLKPTGPKARPPAFTQFSHIDSVLSILHSIHPEHIAEVTYHDCFDQSVGLNRSDMAMFIVLKPGIAFRPGIGSYVLSDTLATMAPIDASSLPRYRFRVLGVFDANTGDPVRDVEVRDPISRMQSKTSATGTVSLFFVPEGVATLSLHHSGFVDTTLTVVISPADTIPITVTMRPASPPSSDDETIGYIGWSAVGTRGGGREAEGGGLLITQPSFMHSRPISF